MWTRRPLRADASPIRRSISSLHHCTAAGPYWTVTPRPFDVGRHRLDHRHLLGRRQRRPQKPPRDAGAGVGRQLRKKLLVRIVDQRIAVAALHRERDMHADVARRLGDRARLGRIVGQALHARVVHHRRADAAARGAPERDHAGEPGIDRRNQREIGQPSLERHVEAADLAQAHDPRMVVRVGERGQHERAAGAQTRGFDAAMRPSAIVMVRSASAGSAALGISHAASMRCSVTRLLPRCRDPLHAELEHARVLRLAGTSGRTRSRPSACCASP